MSTFFPNFFRTMWISTWVVCQSLTIDLAHCSAKSFESNLNVSETRIVFGLKTQNTSEYESRVQYMQYSSSILGLIGKMVHQISCVCTIIYLQKLKKPFVFFILSYSTYIHILLFFPDFFPYISISQITPAMCNVHTWESSSLVIHFTIIFLIKLRPRPLIIYNYLQHLYARRSERDQGLEIVGHHQTSHIDRRE